MTPRREFITGLSAAVTAGVFWPEGLLAKSTAAATDKHGPVLPSRLLGHTGEHVTMLGLGGQHFRRLPGLEPAKAIETCIAGGIRFFDTATMYGEDSLSERLFGEHLTPKYRNEIYLMTKSTADDPKKARADLENSLRNMQGDWLARGIGGGRFA